MCLIPSCNHPDQHAYREGRSTESALHALTSKIERGLEEGNFTLVSFLDIEGAFNNVSTAAVVANLNRRSVPLSLTRLVKSLLTERIIETNLLGCHSQRTINRGTPQGGVLSPLLWNLTLDDLLLRIEERHTAVKVVAYADDIALMVSGIDPNTMRDIMTKCLSTVSRWCEDNGLNTNPTKTELMMFTRRKKWNMRSVTLKRVPLKLSETVKYLGVTLTPTLNWNKHVKKKINQCNIILSQCRRIIGATWGLAPKRVKWVYTAIIRPVLSYGALIWAHSLGPESVNRFNTIQRTACLAVLRAVRSAPLAGMEVMLGLLPLNIHVMDLAKKAQLRLEHNKVWTSWWGHKKVKTKGHVYWLDTKSTKNHPPIDEVPTTYLWEAKYEVTISTRKEWEVLEVANPKESDIICFTDGSRLEGRTGAGVLLKTPDDVIELRIPLGLEASVYQAELFGILTAVREILSRKSENTNIIIYCDNQAVLKNLKKAKCTSKLVLECYSVLNELCSNGNKVTLSWIPGHKGHDGNERADILAKESTSIIVEGPEPFLPPSIRDIKTKISTISAKKHELQWSSETKCRQTKMWFPKLASISRRNFLINCTTSNIRIMTGIITGHNILNRHLHVMGIRQDPSCPKCGDAETSSHLVVDCPAYTRLRMNTLGSAQLNEGMLQSIDLNKVLTFLRRTGRLEATNTNN